MSTNVASERVFNFSAGPAVLPVEVLEQIRDEMLTLPGVGSSVMEISHRSKEFVAILEETQATLSRLLNIPSNYKILFLQGGASLQFSMIPLNLMRGLGLPADYINTGTWGKKAVKEAKREGAVNIAWDGADENYSTLPGSSDLRLSDESAYVYYTSNETIQGVQFEAEPCSVSSPLICDASSDFLSRPIDINKHGLVYACAQKNAGPAGVTVVIIREDLLKRSSDDLHSYLNFRLHAEADSCLNTPPTFAVYVVGLVAKWLLESQGGLEKMAEVNAQKAKTLYDVVDESGGFYVGHSKPQFRSKMNVAFRTRSSDLDKEFLSVASENGLKTLKGHRSVGGMRASIYNAMPVEGVEALASLMKDFANKHAS